jgi:4-amino-4-deoxy-L-arabinose transferase-like glycosyltransferase
VSSSRRRVVAAAALALVLRLGFGLFYWTGQPLTHDEREYLALGRSIARGDGVRYPADEPAPGTAQRFGRAPGYPAFLAGLGITAPVEEVPARITIAQALVSVMAVLLIAALARRAAGERAGVAAAVIAAVYPPLVFMPAYALSETLFSTLALTAAWLLARAGGRERRFAWSIAAGAATAIAILVRPSMLLFVPFACLWLALRPRASGAALARAAVFALAVAAVIAPWTLRNHRESGRWVLVASEGGVTFWTGNHPLAIGEGDLAANPPLKAAEVAFRASHPGLSAEALEPLYYRDALAWIRAHPGDWARLELRKLFFTVVPIGPSYTLHSARYFAASAGAYLLLLPFAAIGAWRLRRAPGAPVPLWLMAASTVLAGLVFFPQERFRIPVIDPALIVTAAAAASLRVDERTGRCSHV